jgi:hypothetical protein
MNLRVESLKPVAGLPTRLMVLGVLRAGYLLKMVGANLP